MIRQIAKKGCDNLKYNLLERCADCKYLYEHLSEETLNYIESVLNKYVNGKIKVSYDCMIIDRFEFTDIETRNEFNCENFAETLIVKWVEGWEDTGYFVESIDAEIQNVEKFGVYSPAIKKIKEFISDGNLDSAYNLYCSVFDKYTIQDDDKVLSKCLKYELKGLSNDDASLLAEYGKRMSEKLLNKVNDNYVPYEDELFEYDI